MSIPVDLGAPAGGLQRGWTAIGFACAALLLVLVVKPAWAITMVAAPALIGGLYASGMGLANAIEAKDKTTTRWSLAALLLVALFGLRMLLA